MKKSLKTFALLGSGLIILSFTLVVINQTAGVVSARQGSPSRPGYGDALGALDRLWRNHRRARRDDHADAEAARTAGERVRPGI